MRTGYVEQGPWWRRKAGGIACLACFAFFGCVAMYSLAWNRSHAATVTENDAMRLLATARTDSEKKQAMAAVYDRVAEMVAAIGEKAKCEGGVGDYARAHLKNMADIATESLAAAGPKAGK